MGASGNSGKAQSRYQRLDNELERNNQDFIEEQLQQQQVGACSERFHVVKYVVNDSITVVLSKR